MSYGNKIDTNILIYWKYNFLKLFKVVPDRISFIYGCLLLPQRPKSYKLYYLSVTGTQKQSELRKSPPSLHDFVSLKKTSQKFTYFARGDIREACR